MHLQHTRESSIPLSYFACPNTLHHRAAKRMVQKGARLPGKVLRCPGNRGQRLLLPARCPGTVFPKAILGHGRMSFCGSQVKHPDMDKYSTSTSRVDRRWQNPAGTNPSTPAVVDRWTFCNHRCHLFVSDNGKRNDKKQNRTLHKRLVFLQPIFAFHPLHVFEWVRIQGDVGRRCKLHREGPFCHPHLWVWAPMTQREGHAASVHSLPRWESHRLWTQYWLDQTTALIGHPNFGGEEID